MRPSQLASAIGLLAVCMPTLISGQTLGFLSAPRVRDQVQLRLEGKKVRYALETSDNFRDIASDQLFLASSTIKVTYPGLNPLKIQVTAAVSETDDPGHSAVAKLIDALLGFPALLKPGTSQAAKANTSSSVACTELTQAFSDLDYLDLNLYPAITNPPEIARNVKEWVDVIDEKLNDKTASAPDAIHAAILKIESYRQQLDGNAGYYTNAKARLKKIFEEDKRDTAPASDSCALQARSIYQLLRVGDPYRRLGELGGLAQTLKDLSKTLDDSYGAKSSWLGKNFIVQDLNPKADKVQKIVAKVLEVKLPVSDLGALTVSKQEVGSATFSLRLYSAFAPEIGAGVVAAFVDQPKYGTSTNSSGQTVVALAKKNSVSIDPSIMMNFVCRCGPNPFFEPMLQVGVATSKDVPAILLGGGLRLFSVGKGDVAVGGGLAIVWTQDLTHLKVGDVISGTKDIDQDLSFNHAPKPRPYFTLQYKF